MVGRGKRRERKMERSGRGKAGNSAQPRREGRGGAGWEGFGSCASIGSEFGVLNPLLTPEVNAALRMIYSTLPSTN